MQDLLINLLASIIAGGAVWFGQRLVRYRLVEQQRRFLGIWPGEDIFLYVSKHSSSPRAKSVHRDDVAALMELATAIKQCGGRPVLVPLEEKSSSPRPATEFCVGGPFANPRTAAHLRAELPGIVFGSQDPQQDLLSFHVGARRFEHLADHEEYALVARVPGATPKHTVLLVMGQRANANMAAARYLVDNMRQLTRRFPNQRRFCLVLLVREPAAFGASRVELVADMTAEASQKPTAQAPPPAPSEEL